MSSPHSTRFSASARPSALALALVLALAVAALAGCSVIRSDTDAQAVVTQKVVGMTAGEFFDRYGRWRTRSELPSGGAAYNWESGVASVAPGPAGLDERVCKLRLLADRNGRIESATVVLDNPGRVSTSRCAELFKGPTGMAPPPSPP